MAQRIVGVDIGTSAVRAVELVVDGNDRPKLEAFGQVGLRAGCVVDGEVHDQAQVTAALRRLWSEGGFRERRVHLGIAGTRAITREIDLPPLPPEELDDVVRLEADEVIPFPMEQTVTSSMVIARTTDDDGTPRIRVLVAAAHRDLVDSVVRAVEEAELEPVGIDLDSAALSRACLTPGSSDATEAIVSVGAGLTLVVAHQGGRLQFVRTVDLGGDAVTEAVASALDLPFIDAEQRKRELVLGRQRPERALSAANGAVDELVSEIHNSVRYFSSLPGRAAPARLLVTGDGARAIGLFEKLQQGTDVPVQLASPLAQVDTGRLAISDADREAISATIAVPLGLALSDPTGHRFNLLPREVTAKRAERKLRRGLAAVGGVVLALLVGGTVSRVVAVHSAEHQVSSLKSQLHVIDTVEIPRYDKAVQLTDQVTSLQHQLTPLVAKEVDWLVVLNQIGQYLPSSAVLTGMQLSASNPAAAAPLRPPPSAPPISPTTPGTTVIGTGSSTVGVPSLTQVTAFGLTMARSPALLNVALAGTVSATGSTVTFPITFDITANAHSQRESLFTKKVP